MASVGERLRRERQRQGRSLAQIAEETRISSRYLAAIEEDDLKYLPGGFFNKSFIQQYARAVGVEDREFEHDLDQLLEGAKTPFIPGQEPPKPGSDLPPISVAGPAGASSTRRVAGALVLLVAVVVACSALYAVWLRTRSSPTMAEVSRFQTQQTAQPPGAQAEPPQPAEPTSAAPQQTSSAGPLNVQIEAKETTWVSITSGGRVLFSGILEPSQTKNLAGLEQARLLVGNAGGLEITSNGRPIGPIGASGQVRVVVLTPEGSEIFPPPKPDSHGSSEEEPKTSPTA